MASRRAGDFPVREIFYRADRTPAPAIFAAARHREDDGWCDAPDDPHYNRLVKLPYPASAEYVARRPSLRPGRVLGYNDDPVVAGKGSAIFLHVAKPDYSPTQGCVALAYRICCGDRAITAGRSGGHRVALTS
jgi:L,D-peptidoglycan transpeptidase YkuD (ErfK/YbiS/YcfS/YnhG family)